MARRWLQWLRRRWLLLALIIAALVLVIIRRAEIEDFVAALLRGQWQWIVAAVLLQVIFCVLNALLYHLAFTIVQVKSRVLSLLPVMFAAVFVNNVAPTAGLGSAALFIDDAARRGESAAQATEGVLLAEVATDLGVAAVLLFGLGYLLLENALGIYQLIGAAFFLIYIAGLIALLFLGWWAPARLYALLHGLRRLANAFARRLGRPDLLRRDWVARTLGGMRIATRAIVAHRRCVVLTLAVSLGLQVVNLATLVALFAAFGGSAALGVLAAGHAVGYVFSVIIFLPYGAAVQQGAMGLVYAMLGVPVALAVAVALVFGGLNAWLPIAIGLLFLRQIRTFGGGPRH